MAFVGVQAVWSSRHRLLNQTAAHGVILTATDQYTSPCCKQTLLYRYRLLPRGCTRPNTHTGRHSTIDKLPRGSEEEEEETRKSGGLAVC